MLQVEDYIGKRRDSKLERQLAQALRSLPEEERFHFLQEWLRHPDTLGYPMGFSLVKACLQKKEYLEEILSQGLESADASRIQWWLDSVLDRLGVRRAAQLLARQASMHPEAVRRAMYWLRGRISAREGRFPAREVALTRAVDAVEEAVAVAVWSRRMLRNVLALVPQSDSVAVEMFDKVTKPVCEDARLQVDSAGRGLVWKATPHALTKAVKSATVIIADVSGADPEIMYQLGMVLILKPEATLTMAHGPLDVLPPEVKSRLVLTYEDGDGGAEQYRQSLHAALLAILDDQRILNAEEFRLVLELLADSGKEDVLFFLLALHKATNPITAEQSIKVAGHNNRSQISASAVSALSVLRPFFRRDIIKLAGDTVSLTEKGRAFCAYIEDHGYVVDSLNDHVFSPGHRPFLG